MSTSPSPSTPNPVDSGTAVDTPPEGFGMKPPEGFAPRQGSVLVRPRLPTHAQLVAAPIAINEIRSGDYQAFLGSDGVTSSELANAFYTAYAWSMTARNARSYMAYARIQEEGAWKHAWSLLDVVKPATVALAAASIRFKTAFSALVRFFDARSVAGKRAHATKVANAEAGIAPRSHKKKAAAAAPAAGGSTTPTAPAAPVAAPSAPANDNPHTQGGAPPTTPAVHAA